MKNEIKLKVIEALQDDAYKGISRIDPALMKELGLERGDIISIKGDKETFCIVDYGYPADGGEEIIRIDGITRKNAKTGIGDFVTVKGSQIKEAKKITIAPSQQGMMIKGDPQALRAGLLGKPVVKGDILVMGGSQKRKDLMSEDFGDLFGDIFNQMGLGMPTGISQIRFVVISTTPNEPCIVTENTQINLLNKFKGNEAILPKEKVIEIITLPNLKDLIEVKTLEDIERVANEGFFINKYETKDIRIYTCSNYYFKIDNFSKKT